MYRPPQFGMRENPASERRHGSQLAVDTKLGPNFIRHEEDVNTARAEPAYVGAQTPAQGAATNAAATGGQSSDDGRLLSIRDVAELLQVPVSWVYGHTRHRCANRIPGIRLGKYWRFQRAAVAAWIDAKREKDYTRVG